ncbi:MULTISPECIES: hypothetical protein [Amycolatopsis]|uniref:Uncharacterized protein n=1 Tax=Amycolatopsis tucumanensis TaxID=401106 RepID=A0ABP7HNK9_9PSEU|nr:hypothetical protein [Amycolatopsis tucumanensis]MCF6421061.1 hypothetical protein [Amycolatopsis tucumanensis]
MTPRTTVAVLSVAAIAVGTFLVFSGLMAQPGFVTPDGSACDPTADLQRYVLEDCLPAEPEGHPLGVPLAGLGLLGLIYARLLMPGQRS